MYTCVCVCVLCTICVRVRARALFLLLDIFRVPITVLDFYIRNYIHVSDMEKMFTYSVEIEIYRHEYARVHVFFFFFCVHLPCSCFYVTHMKEIFVQTIVVFDGLWTYEGGRRKTTNDEIVIVDEETTRNYD